MDEIIVTTPIQATPLPPALPPEHDWIMKYKLPLLIILIVLLLGAIGSVILFSSGKTKSAEENTAQGKQTPPSISQDNVTGYSGVLITTMKKIFVLDPKTNEHSLLVEEAGNRTVYNAIWSPDKHYIAYSTYCENDDCASELVIYDVSTRKKISIQLELSENDANMGDVSYLWKHQKILQYTIKNKEFEYDLTNGKSISSSTPGEVPNEATSENGQLFVYADEGKVYLVDNETEEEKAIDVEQSFGFRVLFSPNTERFIVFSGAGERNSATLFDKEGKKITSFPSEAMNQLVPELENVSLAFSSDNQNIFVLSSSLLPNQSPLLGTWEQKSKYYAFTTDMNGQNTKSVPLDFLGIINAKEGFESVNTITW